MIHNAIGKLLEMHTIAVVGLSPNPARASHGVAKYLIAAGYDIIPVNPGHGEILGLPCYPSLKDIPRPVELVDVFRRTEQTPIIAQAAVEIGAKGLWLQLGIANADSARIARDADLLYMENRCIKIEHARLIG